MRSQYTTSNSTIITLREASDKWGWTLSLKQDGGQSPTSMIDLKKKEVSFMLDADDIKELALFLHKFSVKMV